MNKYQKLINQITRDDLIESQILGFRKERILNRQSFNILDLHQLRKIKNLNKETLN